MPYKDKAIRNAAVIRWRHAHPEKVKQYNKEWYERTGRLLYFQRTRTLDQLASLMKWKHKGVGCQSPVLFESYQKFLQSRK